MEQTYRSAFEKGAGLDGGVEAEVAWAGTAVFVGRGCAEGRGADGALLLLFNRFIAAIAAAPAAFI